VDEKREIVRIDAAVDPSLGMTEVVSSPRSPWQNAYVERVIESMRRE
jgi:hypothetical protein